MLGSWSQKHSKSHLDLETLKVIQHIVNVTTDHVLATGVGFGSIFGCQSKRGNAKVQKAHSQKHVKQESSIEDRALVKCNVVKPTITKQYFLPDDL